VQIEGSGGAAGGGDGDEGEQDGDALDSLNVSVAAGILLHRLLC
jgi:hypothetical protein